MGKTSLFCRMNMHPKTQRTPYAMLWSFKCENLSPASSRKKSLFTIFPIEILQIVGEKWRKKVLFLSMIWMTFFH